MNDVPAIAAPLMQREILVNRLYEAAELEHDLMCTYLYAAASLRTGAQEGLLPAQAESVRRWRQVLLTVAIEEMGHLAAVWNITSALGASPRVGRSNFPLDPGYLPASITVKLAPFNAETLQHFVFLERPQDSDEREGEGFACEHPYVRGTDRPHLTPMARDYATVGEFYARLSEGGRAFVARHGEAVAFDGDPALQLSQAEVNLAGAPPEDGARGVRGHHRAGRGRTARLTRLALPEVSRGARRAAGTHGANFRVQPRLPRGAAPAAPARARVDRGCGRVRHRGSRQRQLRADAAPARLCVHAARAGRREKSHGRPRGGPHAGADAARRAGGAGARRPVQPALQCGGVVHRAARSEPAAAGAGSATPVHRALHRAARGGCRAARGRRSARHAG